MFICVMYIVHAKSTHSKTCNQLTFTHSYLYLFLYLYLQPIPTTFHTKIMHKICPRLENALGLSPVRSIRIACGTIVVITLLTSFFVTSTPSLLPSIMSSFPTSLPPTRPSQSLLLTIVPAVLFATLIGATLYGRNAGINIYI